MKIKYIDHSFFSVEDGIYVYMFTPKISDEGVIFLTDVRILNIITLEFEKNHTGKHPFVLRGIVKNIEENLKYYLINPNNFLRPVRG